MPKVPYHYEVNGKLVTRNGSIIPICSLSSQVHVWLYIHTFFLNYRHKMGTLLATSVGHLWKKNSAMWPLCNECWTWRKVKKKIEDSAFLLTLETKGNNFRRGFLRSCNDRAVFFLRAAAVNRAICRLGSLDNLFRVHFKLDFNLDSSILNPTWPNLLDNLFVTSKNENTNSRIQSDAKCLLRVQSWENQQKPSTFLGGCFSVW